MFINFLSDIVPVLEDNVITSPIISRNNNHFIWTIHNFLSHDICNHIIDIFNEQTNIETINTNNRSSERLLCFDNNKKLESIIKSRLTNDDFIHKLNKHKRVEPYGFDHVIWNKNSNNINPCFRINKYEPKSFGFNYHRDLQYTEDANMKSNYSLVIFLNDQNKGDLELLIPSLNHNSYGLTISEELNKFNFEYITIKPRKGLAVIFDQRLIHIAKPNLETKYILRTDLLCSGIIDKQTKLNINITITR